MSPAPQIAPFPKMPPWSLPGAAFAPPSFDWPPSVHGDGDQGFVAQFVKEARKRGRSPYVGDGANQWPAVHRLDAARLFRLALEKGDAGAKYHGVAETGIPFREIAAAIAANLGVPCGGIAAEQASKHFGILSRFVGADNPSSSEWTRNALDWRPSQIGLLADMSAHYFRRPESLAA